MQQLALDLAPPPAPTLDNFAPGANARALAAVHELVRGDGITVLYLWGATGSGRSHLVRAALAARPDLLALDDVDRLAPAAQIAAFDSFNAQRAGGGRVIATGAQAPAALALRDDLRSRLASGVVIELRPLAEDEKRAALRAHAAERGLTIPAEVVDHLLRHLDRDMGTLMAVLDALDRQSLEAKRPVTLPFARTVVEALRGSPQ